MYYKISLIASHLLIEQMFNYTFLYFAMWRLYCKTMQNLSKAQTYREAAKKSSSLNGRDIKRGGGVKGRAIKEK